jgi:hypothetical protein
MSGAVPCRDGIYLPIIAGFQLVPSTPAVIEPPDTLDMRFVFLNNAT